jgi:hypothetical protein
MSPQRIFNLLSIKVEFGIPLDDYQNGFNSGLSDEAWREQREEEYAEEEGIDEEDPFVRNGVDLEGQDDWTLGYKAGIEAVQEFRKEDKMPEPKEKSELELQIAMRQNCYKMAQAAAPRRMNGVDPEPPREIIQRARYLEHYFTTGELLDAEATPQARKAK